MRRRVTIEFVLCVFGGVFGLHKFYTREWKQGFIYLFTLGLFFLGWLRDIIVIYTDLPPKILSSDDLAAYEDIQRVKQDTMSRSSLKRQRVRQMDREGVLYCPKCKSTSLQYVERRKQLSLTRGVVGGALIGPVGAVVGAVTSNKHKGRVKCLNCGKAWKR